MKRWISSLYKIIVPQALQDKIHFYRSGGARAKRTVLYYYRASEKAVDFLNELSFLERNGFQTIPYDFIKGYDPREVIVLDDSDCRMHYVMYHGSRMYFPSDMSKGEIQGYYNQILIEQDPRSPHCYLTESFRIKANSVIADIGSAEGSFALSNVLSARRCYIFESDNRWLRPLQKTFHPYRDKVIIVNTFVSNKKKIGTTSLDDFFKRLELDFVKIDAEGEEIAILEGAATCLAKRIQQLVICCYHRNSHHKQILNFLRDAGFTVETSSGYVLFQGDREWSPPYFRRGLLRASSP